jgi:hypothetical protein
MPLISVAAVGKSLAYIVDFQDPARPRNPKASSSFIKELATNIGFGEV